MGEEDPFTPLAVNTMSPLKPGMAFIEMNQIKKKAKVKPLKRQKEVASKTLMEALGGTLIIEVIEGKLERDTDAFGKMDCYVQIQYRDYTQRTTTHTDGGQLPVWNQKLEFQLESL